MEAKACAKVDEKFMFFFKARPIWCYVELVKACVNVYDKFMFNTELLYFLHGIWKWTLVPK